MGLGPVIPWKQASWRTFGNHIAWPLGLGCLAGLIGFFLGLRQWYVLCSLVAITFASAIIFTEVVCGTRSIKQHQKSSWIIAFKNLVRGANRRYGGYLIHCGVLLVFMGIAGTLYKTEADFSLRPGESYHLDGYRFVFEKPHFSQDEHKEALTANVDLYKHDALLKKLESAKHYYPASDQVTTEIDLHLNLWRDVYLILGSFDSNTGRAEFKAVINPLISFLWIGGFVILCGVVVVLLPRRSKDENEK